MHILQNVEPELANRLRQLSPTQGHQILADTCRFVSSSITLDAELTSLRDRCLSSEPLTNAERQLLTSYVEAADERYLDLKDDGADEKEWMSWFQKARLATALAKVFEKVSCENLADGVYELTVIFGDSSVVEFIKRSLSKVQA